MKRPIFLAGCLVLAVLVGRYVIPSGKTDRMDRTFPSGNNSQPISTQAPTRMEVQPTEPTADAVGKAQEAPAQAARQEPSVAGFTQTSADSDDTDEDSPAQAVPEAVLAGDRRQTGTGVFINGRELSMQQAMAVARLYHTRVIPGRYWYDIRSGAWGIEGRETFGFLLPGHNFGPMSPNASNGNTGVFINGRQINMIEAARLQQALGAVYRGHWWLDGRTGYYGLEGNPMPLGNIMAALQSQRAGGAETHVSHDGMGVNTSSTGCNSVFTTGAGGSSVAAYPGC